MDAAWGALAEAVGIALLRRRVAGVRRPSRVVGSSATSRSRSVRERVWLGPAALCVLLFVSGVRVQGQDISGPPVLAGDPLVQRFFAVWDSVWRISELDRQGRFDAGINGRVGSGGLARRWNAHCHVLPPTIERSPAYRGGQVVSRNVLFATCPTWFLGGQPYAVGHGEDRGIDAAISPSRLPYVRTLRAALLDTLAARLRSQPTDSVLVGQVLRFALDQRDTALARVATASCRAQRTWCQLLEGYRAVRLGDTATGRAAFSRALASATGAQRCALLSAGELLDPSAWKIYDSIGCTDRVHLDDWLWLLAEPLWIGASTSRRDVHFVRLVDVALRSAWPRDERWTWADSLGGDALKRMVLRYGWPSFVMWGGPATDREHGGTHAMTEGTRPVPPFTTFEYHPGRIHTFPERIDLQDIFSISAADWELSPMRGGDSFRESDPLWWPQEHMLGSPLVVLNQMQSAVLRRQSASHLAVAVSLDAAVLRRTEGTAIREVTLVVATHPESLRVVGSRGGTAGSALTLQADISVAPAVLSVEVPGSGGRYPAARARFGLRPPPALSTMSPGDRAVSAPVLLGVPGGGGAIPPQPDSALQWMLGTTTVPPVGKLGVYWETYGFAPSDTVEHAVWVTRVTPQGALRRLGIRLNVTTDRNTPLAVAWTEMRLGGTAAVVEPGPVPVIGRTVVLDVSTLAPGEYVLEVAARGTSGDAVREQRRFTVAAR